MNNHILTPINTDQALILKTAALNKMIKIRDRMTPITPHAFWPEDGLVLAGGFFSSTYHGTVPHDIDIYVINNAPYVDYIDQLLEVIHNSYPDNNFAGKTNNVIWKSKGLSYFTNKNITQVVTLNGSKFMGPGFPHIQFIFSKYEDRKSIINDFDYKHCTIHLHKDQLYVTPAAWDAMVNKKLVVNNPEMLVDNRMDKFLDAGYKIS